MPRGRFSISPVSTSFTSGTFIPIVRARVIIENSFSGRFGNLCEGSFAIHDPPTPSAGIVRPPADSIMAENFSCTPAREKRSAFSPWRRVSTSSPSPEGRTSPVADLMVTAPGRSSPRAQSRKNSRTGLTFARPARYSRRCPSGSMFEKKGITRVRVSGNSVISPPNSSVNPALTTGLSLSSA